MSILNKFNKGIFPIRIAIEISPNETYTIWCGGEKKF
jgi:hypothetical protein